MLTAVVIHLRAAQGGILTGATGPQVHGFWFRHWRSVNPAVADRLHERSPVRPFTLSPLMGLPRPRDGRIRVFPGTPAWIRITTLERELSDRLHEQWLPRLPNRILLGDLEWEVLGISRAPGDHPWAGEMSLQELTESRLLSPRAPHRWRLVFASPTTFRMESQHLPFPLPDRLVSSWLRRWWAFGTVPIPEGLVERARTGLAISEYALRTVPVRETHRVLIGCQGTAVLRAVDLALWERLAIDLLVAYAFWCGSGHYTAQGMGMTRLLAETEAFNRESSEGMRSGSTTPPESSAGAPDRS
ncbi:CRISPR system precrRNA processing endoribonuclease RAMP protein Cas6 [Thermoflexus hugenholtzii]